MFLPITPLKNGTTKPKKTIIFSFDDGHIKDLKVAELLLKHNFNDAIFYITTDWIDQPRYLTNEHIQNLDNLGFQIGSHTLSHPVDLKRLNEKQIKQEVEESRYILEDLIHKPVTSFCYPRGRYNETVIKYVKSFYYEARTTIVGNVQNPKDLYKIDTSIHLYDREEYNNLGVLRYYDFLKKEKGLFQTSENSYLHVWGHSWEIEKYNYWEMFEELLKKISLDR